MAFVRPQNINLISSVALVLTCSAISTWFIVLRPPNHFDCTKTVSHRKLALIEIPNYKKNGVCRSKSEMNAMRPRLVLIYRQPTRNIVAVALYSIIAEPSSLSHPRTPDHALEGPRAKCKVRTNVGNSCVLTASFRIYH